jgi:pimeloyl-ACP methyl ester carboxylesterase
VEQSIPVEGGEISAEDTGGDGAALVLVHADWSDSGIWSPLTQRLRDRCRVIRYDQRGSGGSPPPSVPHTWLADLRAVLDYTGVSQAAIVAHSGGGSPATGLALAAPQRVAALVLVAPGTDDYPWPEDDPYMSECGRLIAAGDQDGLVALGLRTWAPAGSDAVTQTQIRGAVSAWFTAGRPRRPDPPVYHRLAEITVPTVVVTGDLEYPMVAESATQIASRIPGCRTIVIPGADHMLPLRAPARLAEIISEHVS